ncbi:MAG: 16S rRNA (cytidine(1402)-2'-O)-methyltransferase, partial [Lachnospiraceae bacterium]|nr:16S rRNA (cytidine(1402)-2'-O)-methyltransferase [Lachnospiraceae bacterium]
TPGISDPGEELVRMAHEAGITVTALHVACSSVNALVLSGLPTRRFCFEAFLPTDKKERRQVLEELKRETRTIVLYEAPHRLLRTLQELLEEFGDRSLTVVRELTKKHETVFRTTLAKALVHYTENEPKGECVLVLAGIDMEAVREKQQQDWLLMPLEEHMEHYLSQGMPQKEAMKAVAADRGVPKREIYAQLLRESGKS